MSLAAHLFAAALALPQPWYPPGQEPETGAERAMRLATIAIAVDAETREPPDGWPWSSTDLAWATLAKTWAESRRFALEVHDGRKRGDNGTSICLGQLRLGNRWTGTREHWEALAGTDLAATRRCVRLTAEVLAYHADRCRVPARPSTWGMATAFSGFGTGWSCDPAFNSRHSGRFAQRRAALWWRLRSKD